MAGEVRAESPAPAAASPLHVPEKRAAPEEGGEEERPEPKRRRACVAALDGVPCAAPADGEEGDGHREGSSFSFQHARGGFVALETTPKFGSFNPPPAATEPKPAPPAGKDSLQEEEEEDADAAASRNDGEDKDGNPQLAVGLGVQGQAGRHE